ncbi:hypothetical protein DPMN_055978 [Dreissena polymorpha]|uniref:Apple domain-containing protein n=1 Tax=Dreissena polymorpha TaxID=45954 RepID=A0A9D4HSR6_DREPO|nr:hypothetical protein DPMN_055978 [Dreissena polymorpha]
MECAISCLRQPACVTAQFDKATQSCALFNAYEHTHDPSNSKTTTVFRFAAFFLQNSINFIVIPPN